MRVVFDACLSFFKSILSPCFFLLLPFAFAFAFTFAKAATATTPSEASSEDELLSTGAGAGMCTSLRASESLKSSLEDRTWPCTAPMKARRSSLRYYVLLPAPGRY